MNLMVHFIFCFSISLSHTVAKEDCKSPTKNKSPSKSPINHFSGIELKQSSLTKSSEFSKSPLKSSENEAILKSPSKQSNFLSKNNEIINSLLKHANGNSKVVLCNHVGEQSEKNQSQEPYHDEINTSVIRNLSKTDTANHNLENKTRYSEKMTKEELSININEGNGLELTTDDKMINFQLKNPFNFEFVPENFSKTPEQLGLSQKTQVKVISPKKVNGSNLNVSNPLQDFETSRKSTNNLNETLGDGNDDVARVVNKDKSPIRKSSVSSSRLIANINNDAKSSEKDVRKILFHVEEGKDTTIKLESSIEKEENLNNKVSPLKMKNEIQIGVFKKKSTKKKSVSKSIISNSSNNETKMIGNDNRKALFEKEVNNDSIKDEPSTEKREDLENKVRPHEVKHKKNSRKSLPSKFSPVKTRRTSLRVCGQEGFIETRQSRSLENMYKSFGKVSPNCPKTVQLQGRQRKVTKISPEVRKTEIQKVVKSVLKKNENEKSSNKRNKRKLNSSKEYNVLSKKIKQNDNKHSVEKSGKCEEILEFSKELIKNNEENGILELIQAESATDIYSKELIGCSLNSDILDNVENKFNANENKMLNTSFNKENNKHMETLDKTNREEILDTCMDEVQIKQENTDWDQCESSQVVEICTRNSDNRMEYMDIRSPATVSRNLFSVDIEQGEKMKLDIDGILEQGNSIDSQMETPMNISDNCNQTNKEYLPAIELKNHEKNKDNHSEDKLCSHFTRSSVISKSSRKLDTESSAKYNKEVVAKDVTKRLDMESLAKSNKEVITKDINKKLDKESPVKCNKEVIAKSIIKELETKSPSKCNKEVTLRDIDKKLDTENSAKCNKEVAAKDISKKLDTESSAKCNSEVIMIGINNKLNTETPVKCNKEVLIKDINKKLDVESVTKCNNKVTMNVIDNKSSTTNCKFRSISSNEQGVRENAELSNCDKKLVVCLTNLSHNICCSPIKRIHACNSSFNKDIDITLNKKNLISSRKQEFFKLEIPKENGNDPNSKNKVNDKYNNLNETDETIEVLVSSEDIAMLDANKCTNKPKKNKNPEKEFNKVSGAEEILSNSTVCDEIKKKSKLFLHDSTKPLETTPQKVSEKQAEFLIHSPSVAKIDCTPPKENTTDQHIFSKSNSPVRNIDTQNLLLSSKIINKKLTSPNLTDWVLRTPIKKSSEIDIKCIDTNDAKKILPGTATADIIHESEDLIPSSQEAVDTSMKFLRIVVEKLSELKTVSPKKLNNSSNVERASICNQDELLDTIDTDFLISPKNNNTPLKKSVCRRLVVDTDRGISENKLKFDEENSFVSSPRKIEKQIPVLTSDKEFDQCKELRVKCSEESSNGTDKLVVTESVFDKEALEKTVTADEAQILDNQINQSSLFRKSINRIIPQSPKKSSETEVIHSSPKSPRRRTSQLMALAFKNDSGDGFWTPANRKLKRNQLFRPIDNNGVEHQQPE